MNYITKDDTIIFAPHFNSELDINLLSKFNKLIFSDYELNDKLFEVYENNNFENLTCIKNKFNQEVNKLPHNIIHLTFGWNFNQEVNNLPQNLTHLTFGNHFNQEVNMLPQNIIYLTFGWYFNQEVNMLPQNITHLTFSFWFNQEVKNLPQNITHLTFGKNFDKSLDTLPSSIICLTLGFYFNQSLDNLPSSIQKIIFNEYSVYDVELNCLPNFVEFLQLPRGYDKKILHFPINLKTIKCSENYKYMSDFANYDVGYYKYKYLGNFANYDVEYYD